MKIKKIKKPIISALEQRILFDGAAVATVVDVLDNSSFPSNETTATSNDVTSNNAENTVHEAQAVQGFERDRREVAFVDATVSDYQTLVDGVGEGVEVYLVSSLDDINSILKNEINIDAIHILSHGTTGEITVGNDVLNGNTLDDNALLLETMKNSLSENGDILLYGCNVASDGSGQEFINTLAEITQADVAASNDITGSSTLGGDWDLEVNSGNIETDSLVIENYNDTLGTSVYTFTVTTDPSTTPLTVSNPSDIKIGFYAGYLSGSSYDGNLASYYTSQGFTVSNLDSSKTIDQLTLNYDLLIFQLPSDAFTANEVTAGINFLNTGGRMFFIGEHSGFATYNTNISNYVSSLGGALSITSASFAGAVDQNVGNKNFTDSSINSGVDQFRFNAASWINIDPDISEAVIVDDANNILVGDQAINLGRVTLIADVNPMDTSTNGLSSYDNKIWFKNLAIDSANNRDIVANGGNPNAGFGINAASALLEDTEKTDFSATEFKVSTTNSNAIKIITAPTNGTLFYNGSAVVYSSGISTITSFDATLLKYTPNTNYNGTDSFEWEGSIDGGTNYTSTAATYTITIDPVDDAPTISVSTNPYAVDLDGTNDYLTTNSSILNDISKYTVSFWINPDSLTSNIPVRSLVGQNDAFEIFIKNGDTLTFWNSISGGVDYSLIGILSTGNWTHLAITGDSVKGEVKIYANGVLKTTLNHVTSTNYGNSTYNVTVGGYVQDSTNGGFFDGKLDEISIWNEVKTAEEISTLQTARLTGEESGLLAYWSMDEGTGNSVENKVSRSDVNTNLTLTNGTTWVNSTLNVITTYTEHDTPIIISPSVTIGDTDSSTIESATISISSNFVSGDTLSFTNDDSSKYGNITASYDSSTGVLTLSSSGSTATMQQWKDALENAKFSISSSTDVVNSATKTISWKVNDGSLDSLVDTSSVDVQGFGKMPYIYGTDKATVNEDSSVSLSGFSVGDDDTTILTVSIVSQHGNLSLGTTTGITGYSSATKTLEITGTSTDLQNALNSMVYTPDANYNGLDELVIKTSDDSGKSWSDYYVSRTGLFYNPTNQHYYEFVPFVSGDTKTWDAAKTAAEARTYLGLGGYLATVASAEENALIASKLGGNGWFGASDAESEGIWKWVTGPEAGTQFWQDSTTAGTSSESTAGYTVNRMYANWASGEPNNADSSRGGEDVAHYYSTGANAGKWNDFAATNTSSITGYIVEYGGLSTDISSKPAAAKLEITVVSVNDLPVNNNVPSSVTTNEDTSIVFSSANSNAITITDIDATTVTTTLSIGSGKGTLNVIEGNATTITNNGTTTVQITGTVAQVNAALDGLVYNPTSNANGNAYTTLTISTNDGFSTDSDSVTINVTAVDDLPVANSMAATVGVGSAQLFSYFQPNFFDVDNDAPVAIKLNSAPDKGQFEHWNGTSWEIVSNITPSTPLIVAMSEMNDYRFNALSESNNSTTVQWQVKTAGDTSDTGWSNTATGTITILSYANNTTPSVSITYPTETTTGTPSTQTVEAPDSSNPTSSVETITSNNVIPINEDTQTATITLTYSDSVTPAQFMQGIMTSSNTRLIDFSDPSTFVMTQSVVNNVGTITLILKPKADMYGDTLITLGAFDGQKTSQETFTLRVNSVNEQAIVDNFTKKIDEDTLFSFATINPADIYHDANDVNNNANVSAVDYNAQMAIIKDAMMNPSDTDKQTAKASAITTLVDANYFPQSFIIDTLPTNGDLYLDGTKIVANNYVVAIADLEKLVYQPDLNYFGTDSFTWHALDKEGLASVIKTATFTVNPINDAPVITSPSTIQIVDTTGASINGTITNTLVANDVDNTSLTYKIDSGAGAFVETMVGTYGTLVINSTTGDYEFIPNQSAITALNSDTTETFTLNVSDGLLFDTTTLTINITAAPETASIYTEQADATLILTDTSINTQESYGGGSIEFDLNDPLLTETLDIQKVLNADITAGAVSIVGKAVYLGNGTTASVIGQIDSVYNGENGQKLKINFSVDFANGNFNSLNNSVGLLSSTTNDVVSIDGWNIVNGRVNLGVDTIAGLTTPQDTTNPGRVISATDKDGDILRRGTFYTYVNDDDSSFGDDNSIKLNSSLTSTNGYAIVRGPYIYSDSAVSLKVGDSVQFDWKAEGGADAYDVFGYIVDVNNPSNYQIILNQTGANARATTAWATVSTTIATDGEYKFVFVSGSWDATGGKALGAQLYIDDVKVTQSNPSSGLGSDVLEKIAQKVTYQNSSDLSASNGIINKTVTVTASSGDITPIVHSSTKALNIQEVNDSVTLVSSVSNIYYTDTDGVDNFSNTTGKLSATDADSATVFTYGIDSSTSNGNGTVAKVGSYGTLTLDSSTGEYTFTPDSDVINALSSNVNETFTFSVNDGSGSTDSKVLTINIESVNDAPLLGGVTSTPTFTENGTAVLVDPTITITDLEGTSYDSGYVAFRTSQNGQVEDTLSILNIGGISVSGNNVNYGGVTIGTIDSIYDGQNGKELRINLNSNAYSSQVQALARAITFSNPTDDLSSSARTIEIKINDGGNGGATTARYSTKEAIVNIQTINDLAQINLGNESLVVEKSIFANPNGDLNLGSMISFADLDGDTLTVVIETTNYGLININDSISNGLNSSQMSGNNSRIVTLTGTIEQINNTLAASNGILYTAGTGNDYITPGADYLKVTATDELSGVSTSQKLVMVLPAIPNAYSDNIIGKEDNNAIVDISNLTSDINDNAGTYTFGTGSADITDVNGTITSSGNITAFEADKIVWSSYDIDGDNNPFTQSPIGYQLANGKLILDNDQILGTDFAKFTFIPNENWSGVETFVYQYTSGDAKVSNIAQISIYVTAVNDAPIVTVSNSETINEDSSIVFENTNAITLGDIDIINSNQMLDLTLSVENGKLELAQNSGLTILEGNDNSSKIKVQGNLSNLQNAIDGLKYTSNQDYNGTDALIVKLNDNGNTGESGILESEQTINITINAVNDAPVFTSQVDNVVEGVIINGVLPASDVDSSSLAFSIEGNTPTGFVLNSNGSYTFDSSSYNHLGAGETQTIIVPVSVTDIEGLKTTANFSITITGSNDAPIIQVVDVTASIIEGSKLTDNGSITFTDLDLTDGAKAVEVTKSVTALAQNGTNALVLSQTQQQDIEAAFTINNTSTNTNNGEVTWDYTISENKLDFLGQGETVTATFTITVTDDENATATQDVTVTITGSNDAPIIQVVDVTASIIEGSKLTDNGSITFTDLDLTDRAKAVEVTKSVTALAQNGTNALVLSQTQQQDIEAAFTINNTSTNTNNGEVTWDYTISENKLDFLGQGETVTATFTITVTDDENATATQDVTVTITGSNDAPIIQVVDVTASIIEGSKLTDNGSITFTDLDLTDRAKAVEVTKSVTALAQNGTNALVLSQTQQQDIEAAFTINNTSTNTNNGEVTWDYTISENKLDFLGQGETVTATFTITVTDDENATATQDVTVTITGSNDAPIIQVVDVTASIIEGSKLTDNGSITFTDLDLTDRAKAVEVTKSVTALAQNGTNALVLSQTQQQDIEAAFTINNTSTNTNNGEVTWDYTISENKLDFLGQGETVTATFTITVTDDENATATQDVTVTITGSNDAPIIQVVDVTASIIEGSKLTDNGSITFTDLDLTDRAKAVEVTKSVTALAQNGTNALVLSQTQQQDIEAAFTINNTSTNTNNGEVTWDYTISENKLDFLGQGETVTATFTITVTDDENATATQDVTVTITGSNDAPIIQVVDVTASIIEGSKLTDNGSITFTDLDLTDRAKAVEVTKSVTALAQNGTNALVLSQTQQQDIEAAFTINNTSTNTNNGEVTWDYTISENKLDFLGQGETVTATFTITVTDDENATATQDVTVTITGSNDAPIIQVVDVTASIIEGSKLTDNGSITFTDLDLTDRAKAVEVTKSVTALAQNGTNALVLSQTQQQDIEAAFTINNTSTNTNNGEVTWDYTISENKLDFLGQGETVTATFTITVTDDENATATQDVTVTITGSNDAPIIQVVDVTASIIEGSKLTDNGSITFTDLDLTDRAKAVEVTKSVTALAQNGTNALVLSQTQQQDIEAAFTINNTSTNTNNGEVTWDYTISENKLDFLGQGETVTATFTITVTDDENATATQDVTVTITGSNDAPTVSFENVDDRTSFGEDFTKDIASLFSDKDLTNVFTYEAINLPRGLVIDSSTGVISGAAVESGIFEITLIGKDSGNPSLSVSRAFSLLVISPAQPESIVVVNTPNIGDSNTNNNDIILNNFNDNGQNNLGVLNYSSFEGVSSDTGVGFLSNVTNTNDGLAQNNGLSNNQTEQAASNNVNGTNSTNTNNDNKGLIQADVDLNVLTNGQIVFNQGNQDAFSIVGITVEDIKIENTNLDIKVVDTNFSQNFIVTQIDGSALPQGLSFDPRTGNISGIIPENLDKLNLSIKAINQDGTTRILNLKLDLKELRNKNQVEADEKYIGLKEQIALENQRLDGYGSYLTRLFA